MKTTMEKTTVELFEIVNYERTRKGRKCKITDELINKIKNTFSIMKPSQAFVVPRTMINYSSIRKILKDEAGKFVLQAVGAKRFSKEHTGTRIIRIK